MSEPVAGLYRVAIRRDLAPVKPEALALDGREFCFRPGWVMTKHDTSIYVGETAMIFVDWISVASEFGEDAPIWIASGDLQPVGRSGDGGENNG